MEVFNDMRYVQTKHHHQFQNSNQIADARMITFEKHDTITDSERI